MKSQKWKYLTFLTLLNRAENKKMPIVDGKKIVISDSTKKKKPQRISPWHIFTLPQPAPVVLGLFSKRRECWGTYPLGGNGSLPWESLSRICPLQPWINSSECWFLEIWRAAAIASDCLSNVEVSLELPSPLMPHLSPAGTTCWFLPICYTSFLRPVLTNVS